MAPEQDPNSPDGAYDAAPLSFSLLLLSSCVHAYSLVCSFQSAHQAYPRDARENILRGPMLSACSYVMESP